MQRYGNTIKESCHIQGSNTQPKIIGRIPPPIIECNPNDTLGIRFSRDNGKTFTTFGPETFKAVNSFSARFLQVFTPGKRKTKINIAEHLISALMQLNITDIDIKTTKRVPVAGAGVSGYYNVLKDKVVPNPKRIINDVYLNHDVISNFPQEEILNNGIIRRVEGSKVCYSKLEKGLVRSFSIEPADSLTIEVLASKHEDVMDLEEKSFMVNFWDEKDGFEKHIEAKPIGRVHKILPYVLLGIFSKITRSKAIGPANYTMIYPGSTKEEVRDRMGEKYKKEHNEYLAHSAVSDLPAELYVALHDLGGATIDCKISLSNTNHFFRMEGIKQVMKDKLFTNEQPVDK